jgi:hypothetical protein
VQQPAQSLLPAFRAQAELSVFQPLQAVELLLQAVELHLAVEQR